jgi:AcrR family transcriptional regulator
MIHSSGQTQERGQVQARGRLRRRVILDAALRQFASSGYRGTTIAAVAAAAGITDAGLLYHFPTKESLLVAVLAHHDQIEADRFAEVPGLSDLGAIRRLGAWGEMMEQEPNFMALHVVLSAEHLREESATNTYFRQRYEWLLVMISSLFTNAREAGEIRSDVDPHREASAFVAYVDGLRLQRFFTDSCISLGSAVHDYMDALITRLQP